MNCSIFPGSCECHRNESKVIPKRTKKTTKKTPEHPCWELSVGKKKKKKKTQQRLERLRGDMKEKSWTTFRRLLASPANERDAISDTTVCVEGGGDGCYPNLAGRGRKREGGGRVEGDEEGGGVIERWAS